MEAFALAVLTLGGTSIVGVAIILYLYLSEGTNLLRYGWRLCVLWGALAGLQYACSPFPSNVRLVPAIVCVILLAALSLANGRPGVRKQRAK